ncbi:MAG: ROK family protein [Bacteroidales bacterium]|nr:ROK family protein [Bacteroidales bacterium]
MKKLAVGIDIGGNNTVYGLVDIDGKIVADSSFRTMKYQKFDLFLEALVHGLQLLQESVKEETELIGIGFGAPCGNYYTGNIEHAANLKIWGEVLPVAEKLSVYYPNLPVVITNDANAAAIGEMLYGAAKGMKNFTVITLGTGLGSGIVINGELLYGHDGFAGEFGHIIVSPNGRECGCGRCGCLETYASGSGIVRTVYKLLADHRDPSELKAISFNELTGEMITKAAENGDPVAIEAFAHTGLYLGRALADLVAITAPEAIFLFGGLADAGKYIFEPTREQMEANMLSFWKGKVKLLPSGLENKNAAVLGAAALAWKKFNEQQ